MNAQNRVIRPDLIITNKEIGENVSLHDYLNPSIQRTDNTNVWLHVHKHEYDIVKKIINEWHVTPERVNDIVSTPTLYILFQWAEMWYIESMLQILSISLIYRRKLIIGPSRNFIISYIDKNSDTGLLYDSKYNRIYLQFNYVHSYKFLMFNDNDQDSMYFFVRLTVPTEADDDIITYDLRTKQLEYYGNAINIPSDWTFPIKIIRLS